MTDSETVSTLKPFNASTIPERHRAFSLARILAITSNTLTELTRLKVFYVLLVFGLLNTEHGFLEGFQRTFQLAAIIAFAAAGLLAFTPRSSRVRMD